MSDTKLTRLEMAAKRQGIGTHRSTAKAIEDARHAWCELVAWSKSVLANGEDDSHLGRFLAKSVTEDHDFHAEAPEPCCEEALIRESKWGNQGYALKVWCQHILGFHEPPEPYVPLGSASNPHRDPPVEDPSTDASLTNALREALAQQEPSSHPASEPATVSTDLPTPSPVAPSPPPKTYPILYRGSLLYGDIVELEDHLTIGVFVRDDGTWVGGETHSKTIWRREHGGRLPWEERMHDGAGGILAASIRGL